MERTIPNTITEWLMLVFCDYCIAEIQLEYSLDLGRTWDMVQRECLPSNVDCTNYYDRSVFSSEIYYDWHRVTIILPYYTRLEENVIE